MGDAGVRAFFNHHVRKEAADPADAVFVALLACRCEFSSSVPVSLASRSCCSSVFHYQRHVDDCCTNLTGAGLLMSRKLRRKGLSPQRELRRLCWMCRCSSVSLKCCDESWLWVFKGSEFSAHSLQETAMRVGHKAQSLPLWDEFAVLFHQHTTAVAGLIATADVAEHLAKVAELCSTSSPPLSSWFADLATLVNAAPPGGLHISLDAYNS